MNHLTEPPRPFRAKSLLAIAGLILFLPGALLLGIEEYNELTMSTGQMVMAQSELDAAKNAEMRAEKVPPLAMGELFPPTANLPKFQHEPDWQFSCKVSHKVKTFRPAVGDDIVIQIFAQAELFPSTTTLKAVKADLAEFDERMMCLVMLSAPSLFGDEDSEFYRAVKADEPTLLGTVIGSPDSHGSKAMLMMYESTGPFATLEMADDIVEIEVTRTRLGLPLAVEEWGAKAVFVLGPMLSVPWWIDWYSRRRKRLARKAQS